MDQVFAPWRIEWIRREEQNPDIEECVFCELPALDADRDKRIVATTEHSFVLLNNYPYNPGHVMVIPKPHAAQFADLSDPVLIDHAKLKSKTLTVLEEVMDPAGFNVGLNLGGGPAGGSIDDHLHTHIVPRWEGDTNFMPVIADTTVIVEALEETYDRLHDGFAALPPATREDDQTAVHLDFS